MFGLGWMEIGAILMIALVVFGPKKLPELARKLGEGIREFKNASDSFRASVDEQVHRPDATPKYHDDHDGPVPPEPAPEQLADKNDASGDHGQEEAVEAPGEPETAKKPSQA